MNILIKQNVWPKTDKIVSFFTLNLNAYGNSFAIVIELQFILKIEAFFIVKLLHRLCKLCKKLPFKICLTCDSVIQKNDNCEKIAVNVRYVDCVDLRKY